MLSVLGFGAVDGGALPLACEGADGLVGAMSTLLKRLASARTRRMYSSGVSGSCCCLYGEGFILLEVGEGTSNGNEVSRACGGVVLPQFARNLPWTNQSLLRLHPHRKVSMAQGLRSTPRRCLKNKTLFQKFPVHKISNHRHSHAERIQRQ